MSVETQHFGGVRRVVAARVYVHKCTCTTYLNSRKIEEEDIKITVYLPMLDNMLSGIEVRFHQETLAIITMIDRLIKMENSKDDILKLSQIFFFDSNSLEVEIKLLKQTTTAP
jgi:hypothetical protein